MPSRQVKFTPNNERVVFLWPKPSHDGDGPPHLDENREHIHDRQDRPEFHHNPPEGFENVPSKNEFGMPVADNYVRMERGQVVRDKNDNPLAIREGGAAVLHPDGTHEQILPEQLREFLEMHSEVKSIPPTVDDVVPESVEEGEQVHDQATGETQEENRQ